MIYLELSGGLGNQLFEYAMARRVLEERRKNNPNEKLTLLLDRYNNDVRNYSLKSFMVDDSIRLIPMWKQKILSTYFKAKKHSIMITRTTDSKLISGAKAFAIMCSYGMFCTTDTYDYYPYVLPNKKNIYIYGNYQSEKYFLEIKDILKKEFRIKPSTISADKLLLRGITSKNSVAIHIRRGDYLSSEWGKKLDVCTEMYYMKAINYITEKVEDPEFFIFSNSSDDLRWIKENMRLPGKKTYVNQHGSEIDDFYLMSKCKHHIISNSTYSWWSSYLASNQDKIVIAPSYWYKTQDQNAQDIYLDSWTLIDPE